MKKARHKLSELLEKIEVYFEDILIAVFSIISIIVLVAALALLLNSEKFVSILLGEKFAEVSGVVTLLIVGYIILPWILILGIMVIARDLWLVRRVIEKAVKIEAVLTEELEKEIKTKGKPKKK